ncbi:MAG TPA: hypothetical protein VEI47_10510, partial [Gemmatimonadales bacterium]|nr:hypothetical protein [Gemmatimonadales bacterium]
PGGTLKIQNVAFAALTSVSFGAPSTTGVTIGAGVTQLAGTASAATAPQVLIADPGFSSGVVDATPTFGIDLSGLCGGPCGGRAYKIVVSPGRTVDVTLNWNSNDDLGGYLASSPGGSLLSTTTFPPADNFGPGATGHPEKSTWTLPAGTYTILVIDFEAAASPTQISITLTTH